MPLCLHFNSILFVGYFGMYLLSVHMGYQLFFKNNHSASRRDSLTRKGVFAISLLLWYAILGCFSPEFFFVPIRCLSHELNFSDQHRLLTLVLDQYVEEVSRRMVYSCYSNMLNYSLFGYVKLI